MCLISEAFLESVADFEHAFGKDLCEAVLEDEGMELLLILRD